MLKLRRNLNLSAKIYYPCNNNTYINKTIKQNTNIIKEKVQATGIRVEPNLITAQTRRGRDGRQLPAPAQLGRVCVNNL